MWVPGSGGALSQVAHNIGSLFRQHDCFFNSYPWQFQWTLKSHSPLALGESLKKRSQDWSPLWVVRWNSQLSCWRIIQVLYFLLTFMWSLLLFIDIPVRARERKTKMLKLEIKTTQFGRKKVESWGGSTDFKCSCNLHYPGLRACFTGSPMYFHLHRWKTAPSKEKHTPLTINFFSGLPRHWLGMS